MEVLIATVVLGAGLAVAAGALSTALRAETQAANTTRAARLLDVLLARIESGILPLENAQGDFSAEGNPEVSFSIQVVTTDKEHLLQVDATVTWTEHGDERSETFSRLIYQAPPPEQEGQGQ